MTLMSQIDLSNTLNTYKSPMPIRTYMIQTIKNQKMQESILMETPIEDRKVEIFHPKADIDLAKRLSERLRQKFGTIVKAIVLEQPPKQGFHHRDEKAPMTISVILDDVTADLKQGVIDHYIEGAKKIVSGISTRFAIKNIRLSAYWDGIQSLNPKYTNLLRNGIPLHDKGFIAPMQLLLTTGRIKPTFEAMGVYFARTQVTMRNSRDHMLQGCVDLYWACIDASHALLMHYGYMPPSPSAVAQTMADELLPRGVVGHADCKVMKEMYDLYKSIIHKELLDIGGHSFDVYMKKTQIFVRRVKKLLIETS